MKSVKNKPKNERCIYAVGARFAWRDMCKPKNERVSAWKAVGIFFP